MKNILIFIFLFVSPLYAVFNENCPFASDENVRVISDDNKFGVCIKRSDVQKYKYDVDVVFFDKLEKKSMIFEDDVCYEICYFPKNGDYLFFVSSPLGEGIVLTLNRKSGDISKYFLNDFLEKNNLYKEECLIAAGYSFMIKRWHKNNWATVIGKIILWCGDDCDNPMIFDPKKKIIWFDGNLVKGIEVKKNGARIIKKAHD